MHDFTNINYLRVGNSRQQLAYFELTELKIFENLEMYSPVLTGTIPIEIDIPESDLDIICECKNHTEFSRKLVGLYSKKNSFTINTYKLNRVESTIANFRTKNFVVEIFGQNIPTKEQNAYRHMIIESTILNERDSEFKARVIKLKLEGFKTEPAFAKLLGLKGNPYKELLKKFVL